MDVDEKSAFPQTILLLCGITKNYKAIEVFLTRPINESMGILRYHNINIDGYSRIVLF